MPVRPSASPRRLPKDPGFFLTTPSVPGLFRAGSRLSVLHRTALGIVELNPRDALDERADSEKFRGICEEGVKDAEIGLEQIPFAAAVAVLAVAAAAAAGRQGRQQHQQQHRNSKGQRHASSLGPPPPCRKERSRHQNS
ncbi:hypothetical protein AXG93_313s1180 [Marchantia polymorpha subsp. ruderalis]|uniref:Uncharacterized protein n=1 Tax=Marchantia polymorpha subsp. ruderalis TaxID=1480154 RepID=A0A176VET1_MARPO|nr:hypothetical protein AXG93_313s1180 [Marchantia polymorpha subsp. ruderalis]